MAAATMTRMTASDPAPAVHAQLQPWHDLAACRGHHALFFGPLSERKELRLRREARAKAICETCPVQAECLDWAVAVAEPFGTWGGLSPGERRGLRR